MEMVLNNSLSQLAGELQLDRVPEIWLKNWDSAISHYNEAGLDFLTDEFLISANNILGLTAEMLEAFQKAQDIMRNTPGLRRLAWLWHYVLFHNGPVPQGLNIDAWSAPSKIMGASSDMFHAVILVSGLPFLSRYYKSRKMPEGIYIDTLSDLRISLEEYKMAYGVYGIGKYRMGWLLGHLSGRLFRLGRLQFIHRKLESCMKVFRNDNTGMIIGLIESGVRFEDSGHIVKINNSPDNNEMWITEFYEDYEIVRGYTVDVYGFPLKKIITLSKKEWKLLLSKGDGVLDVHIPRGYKMDYELCKEAYSMAMEFYPRYLPELQFKGFTCTSWLLNPILRSMLSEDSNIIRFQKDYYLFPVQYDESVFEYVFGNKPDDLRDLPDVTHLQRSIKNYLLKAGNFSSSGGIILKESFMGENR